MPSPTPESSQSLSLRCVMGGCAFNPSSVAQLVDHQMAHTRSFVCPQCSDELTTFNSLKNHINTKHYTVYVYRCETCSTLYSDPTRLARCQKSHLGQFLCPMAGCDYYNKRKDGVVRHIRVTHKVVPGTQEIPFDPHRGSTEPPRSRADTRDLASVLPSDTDVENMERLLKQAETERTERIQHARRFRALAANDGKTGEQSYSAANSPAHSDPTRRSPSSGVQQSYEQPEAFELPPQVDDPTVLHGYQYGEPQHFLYHHGESSTSVMAHSTSMVDFHPNSAGSYAATSYDIQPRAAYYHLDDPSASHNVQFINQMSAGPPPPMQTFNFTSGHSPPRGVDASGSFSHGDDNMYYRF